MAHVTDALHRFTINRIVYWVESMTVLYWLDNKATWSHYVRNRVKKIQELSKGEWQHVTTYQNPSDAGTRGTTKITEMWLKGPQWLRDEREWPKQTEIVQTNEGANKKVNKKSVIIHTTEKRPIPNMEICWTLTKIQTYLHSERNIISQSDPCQHQLRQCYHFIEPSLSNHFLW